ncbi:MAG: FixH family protein [Ginsengibacter sp.]
MKNNQHQKKYGFWNWGTGITITFIVCASLMLLLVYKTTTVDLDMAEPDYYSQELKFNQKLQAMTNANQLSTPISILQNEQVIRINVPHECIHGASGEILLYRPSSEKHDFVLPFAPDSNGDILIEKNRLIKGIYKLKADWEMKGKPYHQEQSFFVEK